MVSAINGAIQFLIATELANNELEVALVALVQFSIWATLPVFVTVRLTNKKKKKKKRQNAPAKPF
jgi:large-conductance mechanosensitive channel